MRAALAFLTRIPCASNSQSPTPSLLWFSVAGLVIGIICSCVAFLTLWVIAPGGVPGTLAATLAAWLWVALEVWLSRGMHWDGVADLADALGSGATGDKFRAVLKDSRLGAFGAISLFLLLILQATAISLHLAKIPQSVWLALTPLVLAPAWARLAVIWLAYESDAHGSGLGACICGQATRKVWLLSWLQVVLILALCFATGVQFWAGLVLAVGQSLLTAWFRRLGHKYGGLSGDFFGCQIEASQTLFLLVTLVKF